jgi:hypothetical protein
MYLDDDFYRLELREGGKMKLMLCKFRYSDHLYTVTPFPLWIQDLRNDERIVCIRQRVNFRIKEAN